MSIAFTRQGADILKTIHGGIRQTHIAHRPSGGNSAEQPQILIKGLVNRQARNSVSGPVKIRGQIGDEQTGRQRYIG